jgi:hypothetical protein
VIWEVQCASGLVSVTALGSYRSQAEAMEASCDDVNRQVVVWHVPGDTSLGRFHPPPWDRGLFAAGWTTAMAAVGWLGVAAYMQLAWRRIGGSEDAEPAAD